MTVRLVLLCAGATAAMRAARFPDPDDPLDRAGLAKASALRLGGWANWPCRTSPARAAGETAAVLRLSASVEPALADQDAGAWRGCALDDIAPAALATWLAAPEHGAPAGESLDAVRARVAAWLDTLAAGGEARLLAVTHAAVIRAALAHVLGVPTAATLAIDVAPLTAAVLSFSDRWRVQELRRGGAGSSP
ncbi:histidine phosphatase family protein [Sphingomonas sp. DT-51]|uniref:histidine phosphatase family protein n=1 Tax=Sphingomonas sp. DT-51 TaxID=3396165 RepID=UPI003F1A8469